MRLEPLTRLLAVTVLVFAATAVLWWLVGFPLGKAVMEELDAAGAFRAAYGLAPEGFARLLLLATLAAVIPPALEDAPAGWGFPALVLVALLAGTLVQLGGAAGPGHAAGAVLFVLGLAATRGPEGAPVRWGAIAGVALLVAFAFGLDLDVRAGPAAVADLLRAALFVAPLLAGPVLVERLGILPRAAA